MGTVKLINTGEATAERILAPNNTVIDDYNNDAQLAAMWTSLFDPAGTKAGTAALIVSKAAFATGSAALAQDIQSANAGGYTLMAKTKIACDVLSLASNVIMYVGAAAALSNSPQGKALAFWCAATGDLIDLAALGIKNASGIYNGTPIALNELETDLVEGGPYLSNPSSGLSGVLGLLEVTGDGLLEIENVLNQASNVIQNLGSSTFFETANTAAIAFNTLETAGNLFSSFGSLIVTKQTVNDVVVNSTSDITDGTAPNIITTNDINSSASGALTITGSSAGGIINQTSTTNSDGSENEIIQGSTSLGSYSQVTGFSAGAQVTATIRGQGDTAALSDATITLASGSQATVAGDGNTIVAGSGASVTVSGVGNAVQIFGSIADASTTFDAAGDEQIELGSATVIIPTGYSVSITGSDGTMVADNNAEGDGTISNTINWSAGGSQVQLFSSLETGTTREDLNYLGGNGTGKLLSTVFDADTTTANPQPFGFNTTEVSDLGYLVINSATDTDTFALPDGAVITTAYNGVADPAVSPGTQSPLQIVSSYLGAVGESMATAALTTLNYNYLNPTGTPYTVTGTSGGTGIKDFSVYLTPGAVVTGISGYTNVLNATGDISNDTISNVQTLNAAIEVELTSAQFNNFSSIAGGELTVTTGGTDTLAGSSAAIRSMSASGWGGTTLVGNDTAGQILEASQLGNDTLVAGSGAGDALVTGGGVDELIGGVGGDSFVALDGAAAGSVLIGGSGTDTLQAAGDFSQATITGIEVLDGVAVPVSLDAAEFDSFSTFDAPYLEAATPGTYDLTGKTIEGSLAVAAISAGSVTIISGDATGGTAITLVASGTGDDTLTAGNASGDNLSASGSGNDTLSAGSGAHESLIASGNGNDNLIAGDGNNDILSATGSGTDTLTVGDGNGDVLTASNGSDTLTAGTGNDDSMTVTTDGNILNMGAGSGDVLTAEGSDNTLNGGSGGDTFNLYDNTTTAVSENTAIGGSGNDTFNLLGALNGTIDLAGTTIDGGGGTNILVAGVPLDISEANISNIQTIIAEDLTLSVSQLSGITDINAENIYLSAPGNYSFSNVATSATINDSASGGGSTITGSNTANQTFFVQEAGDTIVTGTGTGDFVEDTGASGIGTANGSQAYLVLIGANSTATGNAASDIVQLQGGDSVANINGVNDIFYLDNVGGDTVTDAGSNATINDETSGGNSFTFSGDFGQAIIDITNSGVQDEIYFAPGVTDQNLWFQQVGNNLQIDLMGTAQSVTIDNWFASNSAQVQSVILSNGYQLSQNNVSALVTAMANYAANNESFNPSAVSSAPANPALQAAIMAAWSASVIISDTAANVAFELNTLQSLAGAGQLAAIELTDFGTPVLSITDAQLTADASALAKVTGSYSLHVSGVSAADATTIASQSNIFSISVSDTAADVADNIDSLQAVSADLTSINLTDTGTPILDISDAQLNADSSAVAEISGSYDLVLSNVPVSNLAAVDANTSVISFTIADKVANVLANISTLETLAASGSVTSIILTDPGVPLVAITAAELKADSDALTALSGTIDQTVVIDSTGSASLSGTLQAIYLGNNTLWIGDGAAASLFVSGGNLLQAGDVDVGETGTGSGTLTVDGTGSLLEASTIAVGGTTSAPGGTGQLIISDGAVASVSDLQLWSGGRVTMADGSLETDPVTITGGTIIGNGVVSGDIRNNGTITADGGLLDLAGDVGGAGLLAIDPGAILLLEGSVAATDSLTFSGIGESLIIGANVEVSAPITGFGPADDIALTGISSITSESFSNGVLTIDENNTSISLTFASPVAFGSSLSFSSSAGNLDITTACFASGTHILTPRGELAVEDLSEGDAIITNAGQKPPIKWIGKRRLDLSRHPHPENVQPIRFEADCFADDVPTRDLFLSPDHALYIDGILVPAKALTNGKNIRQLVVPTVTYYHVELYEHSVIFAENIPVETYLDTGNRGAFENCDGAMTLHPDFAQTEREARGCAPFIESGPQVEAIRTRLLRRANIQTTEDPALTIKYRNDGAVIQSRHAIPALITADPRDRRRLGVKVSRIIVGGHHIPFDHPALIEGWHDCEPDGRWTDGSAVIPAELLAGANDISVVLAAVLRYPVAA